MQCCRSAVCTPSAQPSPSSASSGRPVKSSQGLLKWVQRLSVPEIQASSGSLSTTALNISPVSQCDSVPKIIWGSVDVDGALRERSGRHCTVRPAHAREMLGGACMLEAVGLIAAYGKERQRIRQLVPHPFHFPRRLDMAIP